MFSVLHKRELFKKLYTAIFQKIIIFTGIIMKASNLILNLLASMPRFKPWDITEKYEHSEVHWMKSQKLCRQNIVKNVLSSKLEGKLILGKQYMTTFSNCYHKINTWLFFLFLVGWDWVSWYCGHYRPIGGVEIGDWQGNPKYSEKICPSTTLSTTHPTWIDPGLNPGLRGGKPETNR
jgi:hypothetical protein